MFTCAECGDNIETRYLSKRSLDKAGTETRAQALLALPEIEHVCVWCDDILEEQGESSEDMSNYTYSGQYLSELTKLERDWLNLYY